MEPSRSEIIQYFKDQQIQISKEMATANQRDCLIKPWESHGILGQSKGKGIVNYFDGGGAFLEKGCVNTTVMEGPVLSSMSTVLSEAQRKSGKAFHYLATGISIIFHPRSPMIPSIHANLRYFEVHNEQNEIESAFFGGGIDLTPFYCFPEDFKHFHTTLKQACDRVDVDLYPHLKKKADEYYFIAHRLEHRGIGGVLNSHFTDMPHSSVFHWVQEACSSILPSYLPIVDRRVNEPYSEDQRYWQLLRRGHYIEFNMHYDPGFNFLFSLNHQPTIENSFMSLPPFAAWQYDHHPAPGSKEEEMMEILKNPRDWV